MMHDRDCGITDLPSEIGGIILCIMHDRSIAKEIGESEFGRRKDRTDGTL